MREITFKHAPTLRAALLSSADVRIVQGPVESGKSVWLLGALYKMACEMPRCKDGIRRSRFLITRQTEAELRRGIIRTYKDWFDEETYGELKGKMPVIANAKFLDVEMEVEFFAFDGDSVASLKRLRSTEYTAAAINEGQYESMKFVLAVRQRTGRYPSREMCPDYDRKKRLVMDMNAPQTDLHWVPMMRGDIPIPADYSKREKLELRCPPDWEFFVQPPIVLPIHDEEGDIIDFEINEDAGENLPFQDREAILSMCATGALDDIKRDYMNLTVQVKSGRPRYPKFQRDKQVSKERLDPIENAPPIIGYDPGINGAAVIFQRINSRWRAIHEIYCRGNPDLNSAAKVGKRMRQMLDDHYPWWRKTGASFWGDPFGTRQQTGPEDTYYKIIAEQGIQFLTPEPKDNPAIRWEIGKAIVEQFPEGQPRLEICPIGCPMLVDAFDGGATMMVEKIEGGEGIKETINKKSKYADIIEAAEYAFWGGGESVSIVEGPKAEQPKPHIPQGRHQIMSRRGVGSRGNRRIKLGRR